MSAPPGAVLLDDGGRIVSATVLASRLLALAGGRERARSALRGLHARTATADPDQHVVSGLPLDSGGRLVLTAARAGRGVVVVVEAQAPQASSVDVSSFTPREREVVGFLIQGLATKQIAAQMHLSPWTITDHLREIYAKAGVSGRTELMALAIGARAA